MADIIIKTSDYVNVLVSASCQSVAIEKRFKKDITVLELKVSIIRDQDYLPWNT